MKQTIAIDIDGVVADFFGPFLLHASDRLDTTFALEDCTHHNSAIAFGVPEETMHGILADFENTEVGRNLPHIPLAIESLHLLTEHYNIQVITSRREVLRDMTKEWFARHFTEVPIHHGRGRNNPYGGGADTLHKPQIAESIGAIALIEDNADELIHWDAPSVTPICFPQPWNASLAESHPHILRLDWPGIVDYFIPN